VGHSPQRNSRSSVSNIDCSNIHNIGSFHTELFSSSELDDSAQSILEHHVSRVWDNSVVSSTSLSADVDASYQSHHHRGRRYAALPSANHSMFDSSIHPSSNAGRAIRSGSTLSSSASTFDSGVVRDDGRHGSVGHFDVDCEVPMYSMHDRQRLQRYNDYLGMTESNNQQQRHHTQHHSRGGPTPQLQSTPRVKGPCMSRSESEKLDERTVCAERNYCDSFKRPAIDTRRSHGQGGVMSGSVASLPNREVFYHSDSQSNVDEPSKHR